MDTRAHFKRFLLMQWGPALLCVLFCLASGCQRITQQPAETGDPDLAQLAMKMSEGGEPNDLGASAAGTEPAVSVKPAPTPPAAPTRAEPAAPVTAGKAETPAPAVAKKVETPAPVVKKAQTTPPAPAGKTVTTAPAAAPPAAAPKTEPVPPVAPADTPPAKSPGPETISPAPEASAQPEPDAKSKELTKNDPVGREVIISEPTPVKNLLIPDLKVPAVALDAIPLAAANPAVDAAPAQPAFATEAAADTGSQAETEGERSVSRGLLGYGRSAIAYAAEHYILLGSVALATPAVIIFARKRKFFRRPFRRMKLDD